MQRYSKKTTLRNVVLFRSTI